MALACANVAAASFMATTGGDPVTIPSHTVNANSLYTFGIVTSTNTATVASVTLPGTGTEVLLGDRPRATLFVVTVGYMLCTAGGTGTGSIDLNAASTGCGFVLDEWTGIDLSDPVIDANIVENDGTDATPPTPIAITLPNALAKTTNAIWGCVGANETGNVPGITPGADYTATFNATHTVPGREIFAQYDVSPVDLVFDCEDAEAVQWAAMAFEVNEATAAGTEDPYPYVGGGYFPVEG